MEDERHDRKKKATTFIKIGLMLSMIGVFLAMLSAGMHMLCALASVPIGPRVLVFSFAFPGSVALVGCGATMVGAFIEFLND